MNTQLTKTFELNRHIYRTDHETLNLVRKIVSAAQQSGDSSALVAVFEWGFACTRIEQLVKCFSCNGNGHVLQLQMDGFTRNFGPYSRKKCTRCCGFGLVKRRNHLKVDFTQAGRTSLSFAIK